MGIGVFTRLETVADLETLFAPVAAGTSDGRWAPDAGGSTGSGSTGPGQNSAGPYVYSETSGAGIADIRTNSTLAFQAGIMSQWIGAGRTLEFRACIQGAAWVDVGEGFEVQGRATSTDAWERIALLEGWGFDAYVTGDTITDANGDGQMCAQDGGWVDFVVGIPDTHTEVRLRSMPVDGGGGFFQHDLALWRIKLVAGPPGVHVGAVAPIVSGPPALAAAAERVDRVTHDAAVAPIVSGPPALAAAAERVDRVTHDAAVAPIVSGPPALAAAAERVDRVTHDAVVDPLVSGAPGLAASAELSGAVTVAVAGQAITVTASDATVAGVVRALRADVGARALVVTALDPGADGAALVAAAAPQALAGGADEHDPGFRVRIEIFNSAVLLGGGLLAIRDQIQRVKRVSVHETIVAVGAGLPPARLALVGAVGAVVVPPVLELRAGV